ncbi:hypothetical protein EV191_102143 [Tamaricihabitans halophyticus]|uniref:Uncharacterized protein n=1 Tax=Tamaricihabitans halophyticus TaxID=1262583 RepID=A0A4R2QXP9_9PSEU|nr:hypothetical protein [Tamaricihabitans halophyticus]TCP54933.1 hypothetical protein EV191_102143 [Tamaricihabitans halophyticus]
MIEQDRILLGRVMRFNTQLGRATMHLFEHHQDNDELPAEQLRDLGEHMRQLGVDLLARAGELDGLPFARAVVDSPET